jgi:hypothetical protein
MAAPMSDILISHGVKSAIIINIPGTLMCVGSNKTREMYINEVFRDLVPNGFQMEFLNATVRHDILSDDPLYAARSAGYIGKDLKEQIIGYLGHADQDGIEAICTKIVTDIFHLDIPFAEKLLAQDSADDAGVMLEEFLGKLEVEERFKTIFRDCFKSFQALFKSKLGRAACSTSHLRALKRAKELCDSDATIKAVMIGEDDMCFARNPQEFGEIFDTAMKHLEHQEWDMFMLGASSHRPLELKDKANAQKVEETPYLVKVRAAYGNFSYIVNRSSIPNLIKMIEDHVTQNKRLDIPTLIEPQDVIFARAMMEGKLKAYSTEPVLASCVPCNSTLVLTDTIMDYSQYVDHPWTLSC